MCCPPIDGFYDDSIEKMLAWVASCFHSLPMLDILYRCLISVYLVYLQYQLIVTNMVVHQKELQF